MRFLQRDLARQEPCRNRRSFARGLPSSCWRFPRPEGRSGNRNTFRRCRRRVHAGCFGDHRRL